VAELVRKFAPLRAPVLLLGESGTGKDVVAHALHSLSQRSGELVPLNVGAITESLADSELFGHRRGAFTGAIAARPGAFELAQGGTLFLDEIGDLPASLQVKLLRVVEDGMVRSVGATQTTKVDVRLVSATWALLDERVARGSFRADLLHRLSTVVIRLPPLRRRASDIPELCRVLLARYRSELGEKRVSSAALARLVEYGWPGNVRELASVLYRGAVAAPGETIDVVHVELPAQTGHRARPEPLSPAEVLELLSRCGGNTTEAARAARVPRSTFRSWLQKARSDQPG
jgi:DNA-binding NtrC family response regulator